MQLLSSRPPVAAEMPRSRPSAAGAQQLRRPQAAPPGSAQGPSAGPAPRRGSGRGRRACPPGRWALRARDTPTAAA